jgi:hypothetical protein
MFGLPQAGRLSQLRLISHLTEHGYHQCPTPPVSSGTKHSMLLSVSSSKTLAFDMALSLTPITSSLLSVRTTMSILLKKPTTFTWACESRLVLLTLAYQCLDTSLRPYNASIPSTFSQLTELLLHRKIPRRCLPSNPARERG